MPLKAEALRGKVFHSANCVKVFGHFADCFVVNKIYCLKFNTERILNIIHKAHRVKRAHPEIKAEIVFSLDFVNFHVVFNELNKLFEFLHNGPPFLSLSVS